MPIEEAKKVNREEGSDGEMLMPQREDEGRGERKGEGQWRRETPLTPYLLCQLEISFINPKRQPSSRKPPETEEPINRRWS